MTSERSATTSNRDASKLVLPVAYIGGIVVAVAWAIGEIRSAHAESSAAVRTVAEVRAEAMRTVAEVRAEAAATAERLAADNKAQDARIAAQDVVAAEVRARLLSIETMVAEIRRDLRGERGR